jgi:DNA-binding IclR family transcriptional regulator
MHTVRALEQLTTTGCSASELGEALSVDHRTARRLLRRLHSERYVTVTAGPRRRYHLTHRLAALGRQAIAHDPLAQRAAPHVALLAASTGHTASLWIACHRDVVCILAAKPNDRIPQPTLGELRPAHTTAPGKALLAHHRQWRDKLLAKPLPGVTPNTITDPRDLCADLQHIRTRRYTTDTRGHHDDAQTIATPIFEHDDAIAALALALAGDDETAAAHLVSAAETLTHALTSH